MEIASADLGAVIGHEAAKRRFLDALAAGHLHHGWMLRGPRGIGKSRLALQFAAALLSATPNPNLDVDEDDPVGRLIAAGSHPDLRVIRVPTDDKGKQKTEIPVDSVRELSEFFSLRPAMGGWRVAIIDAADELNRFGANAILKTLEEPPSRAILFLISHGERMLPPTLRSRCRLLPCAPLSEAETVRVLELAQMPRARAEDAAAAFPGRPGRALTVQGPEADAAIEAVRTALRQLDRIDASALRSALTTSSRSDAAMAAAMETLRVSLHKRAAREFDPVAAGDWASVALDAARIEAEGRDLNQDKGQTVAAVLARVARMAGG